MTKPTLDVLIVDDNPVDRETVRHFLSRDSSSSYCFTERSSVCSGLEVVAGQRPNCILLDYELTDGDGLEFLEELRAFGGTQTIPVVMLTATGDENVAVAAMKAGAQDYMVKGRLTPEVLIRAVHTAIFKAETQRILEKQRMELERLYLEAQEASRRKDELVNELRAAKEQAEQANAAKDQFLATLSHELRTPLMPVLMTAAALELEPNLTPEVRTQIGMIRRNIELEARLIDDLLDLTRISRGKFQLLLNTTDVHSLLAQTDDIVRSDVNAKRVEVQFDFGALEHHVHGDGARLQQVFWNLIKNAVKFTNPGGVITVRTFNPKPGRVAVIVSDNGIGIDPENLPHIFNAFEQGEVAGQHRFGGLGLGLAITRAIVEMHGGAVRADSAGKGRGATFTVELQTAPAPAPAKISLHPKAPETNSSLRLLIIEDHEPTLAVLTRLLQRRGHTVSAASTIGYALELAADGTFDLVISDIGLPDGSGIELMRQLAARHGLKGIALSGYGMEGDITRAREAGFVAHLVKPVNFDQLQRVLEQVVVGVPA